MKSVYEIMTTAIAVVLFILCVSLCMLILRNRVRLEREVYDTTELNYLVEEGT